MSHFTLAGGTKDPKIYGPDEAKKLAASNPAAAQRNAENLEYFVEALVFGP
ncbi:M35 family metallo-endopeptidase [Bradyrhizobium japonicum]|uniref:M35 family metallo-endopeptidase n=1 Tax=Bradyrhizobium japonicum TaxID=375 RepID=UPI0035C90D62